MGELGPTRIVLALTGVGLSVGYYFLVRRGGTTRRRLFTAILAAVAAYAFYTFMGIGPQFNRTGVFQLMNTHDFFHYYVGAKYHAELGYFDMYECSAIADRETRRRLRPNAKIRDLRTYKLKRASTVVAESSCKDRFSEERWEEFRSDIETLTGHMSRRTWQNVMKDKGYNATPAWTAWISALTNAIPLSSGPGLVTILSLDWLFTLAIFTAVGLTFGWIGCLLVVLFWGVNVVTSFGFVKGSVSRLDWLLCLVLSMCALGRGRHAWAGALAGVATALRLFPALFFVALLFKAVYGLVRTRTVPRRYLRFGAAFAIAAVVLVGGTSATQNEQQSWGAFADKIAIHDSYLAGYRVGMKYAVIDPKATKSKRNAARSLESRTPVLWTVRLLALVAVFWAARRLSDHRTMALSFVCVFFFTAPTFYYYQMLAIPFGLFLPDERRPRLVLGAAVFFAWAALGYWFRDTFPLGMPLSHLLSWSILALCVLVVIVAAYVRDGNDVAVPRDDRKEPTDTLADDRDESGTMRSDGDDGARGQAGE
jgi:hypothetical protein